MVKLRPGKTNDRLAELRLMLEERRSAILHELRQGLGKIKKDGVNSGLDNAETADLDNEDGVQMELMQMNSGMFQRIEAALQRIEEGTYGNCFECGGEIAERRIRAEPTAVRCKDCEEARETAAKKAESSQPRWSSPLFVLEF